MDVAFAAGGGGAGEDGAGDGWDAWYGDFAGEGGVAQDLGGGIEVSERVGGDDHDGLLGVAVV